MRTSGIRGGGVMRFGVETGREAERAMDLGIDGRVALVTGASSGIGEAVALALADEGVKLAVAARPSRAAGRDRLAGKAAGAADARGFEVDLVQPPRLGGSPRSRPLHAAFGKYIDILVLNGGGPKPGRFADVTLRGLGCDLPRVLRGMAGSW